MLIPFDAGSNFAGTNVKEREARGILPGDEGEMRSESDRLDALYVSFRLILPFSAYGLLMTMVVL